MFHIFEIKRVFVHLKHPLRYELLMVEGMYLNKKAGERMLLHLRSLLYSPSKLCVSFIRFRFIYSHKNCLSLTDDYEPAFGNVN